MLTSPVVLLATLWILVWSAGSEADLQAEYARQRQYLERTLDGLKRKAEKEAELRQMDRAKMFRENAVLVEEVNNLRREVKLIQQDIACAEMGVETTVQPRPPALPRSGTTPKASTTTTALATARNMSIGGVLIAPTEDNSARGGRSGTTSAAVTTRSHDGMLREAEMQRVTIAQASVLLWFFLCSCSSRCVRALNFPHHSCKRELRR